MLIQIKQIRTNVLGWFRRLDTLVLLHFIYKKGGCE